MAGFCATKTGCLILQKGRREDQLSIWKEYVWRHRTWAGIFPAVYLEHLHIDFTVRGYFKSQLVAIACMQLDIHQAGSSYYWRSHAAPNPTLAANLKHLFMISGIRPPVLPYSLPSRSITSPSINRQDVVYARPCGPMLTTHIIRVLTKLTMATQNANRFSLPETPYVRSTSSSITSQSFLSPLATFKG